MKNEKRDRLKEFLRDQIAQGAFRTKAYVYDDRGNPNPRRSIFETLNSYVGQYANGKTAARWLVVPGLRGTGKTTLLAQLYHTTSVPDQRKLFLSVDQVTQTFGTSLQDIILVYEQMLGTSFEQLREPVFLFLDEVQYDEKWAAFLKTVYDRSRKVFIIATGSSAVMLNVNPDIARRAISVPLAPMCFTEYMQVKHGKREVRTLSEELRHILFESPDARTAHDALSKLRREVDAYWLDVSPDEIPQYMQYGTLPYMVALNNEAAVYDQIKKTLDRVVSVDLAQIGGFRPEVLSKFPMLLYALADSDTLSVNGMSVSLETSRPTIMRMLEMLEYTELIVRVFPYGTHRTQVRKPSKYFFSSPAFRAMYFRFIGSTQSQDQYEGKLIEDTVRLYLSRIAELYANSSLTFDAGSGGADFILKLPSRAIAVETGRGKKNFRQVATTLRKMPPSSYGLVVSRSELSVADDGSALSVPFELFLLL